MTTPKKIHFACESSVKKISIKNILPLHQVAPRTRKSLKYLSIAASINEVGIIEPLVVHPQEDSDGFLLLDGHVRLDVLTEAGEDSVDCLIALDDEAFTYNHKINRLNAIQEHFMIMKAIKNGVTEDAIAAALNVDIAKIREKKNLLVGICSEVVQLLRGKQANADTFRQLRKAKPMRQIEMSELMCATCNFSARYAKCLIASTPQEQLIESEQMKEINGLSQADMARMEREMESISTDFKQIEETHGKNVLNLVIVIGYLKKMLDNGRVVRYLAANYQELLDEFHKLIELRTLTETPSK
tara:strand:- start:21883 stop:22782 length:900 start_codon:yes stop_codon:yes gene_type:complete